MENAWEGDSANVFPSSPPALLLVYAVLAENVIRVPSVRRLRIQIDVGTIVEPVVLGQPDHPIASRLGRDAMRGRLIALQLKGFAGLIDSHEDDSVVCARIFHRDRGLVLREQRCGTDQKEEEENNALLHGVLLATHPRGLVPEVALQAELAQFKYGLCLAIPL